MRWDEEGSEETIAERAILNTHHKPLEDFSGRSCVQNPLCITHPTPATRGEFWLSERLLKEFDDIPQRHKQYGARSKPMFLSGACLPSGTLSKAVSVYGARKFRV